MRGALAYWVDDKLLENVSVHFGCGKIMIARRIKYKIVVNAVVPYNNAETVVLTFDN